MKKILNICDTKIFFRTVYEFSVNDFKKKYSGSALGIAWAYIQTIVMVLIYWIVFQFGLRVGGASGTPFLAWFVAGYMPWLLFSDIITSSIGCMSEYSYIVKKIVFNIDIIPISKIVVCMFIHSVFLLIVLGIAFAYGIFTGIYLLQVLYYLAALLLLVIPLAFLCSAVSVFFKDFGQIISILLNILMWATPIVWDFSIVSPELSFLFKINPMFYIINCFRGSILFSSSIFDDIFTGIYFWIVVIFLWVKCIKIYRSLVPHMADVL